MKNFLFTILCVLGMYGMAIAQENDTKKTTPTETGLEQESLEMEETQNEGEEEYDEEEGYAQEWYVSAGIASLESYKINNNLQAQGLPELPTNLLEMGVGYTIWADNLLMDIEFNANYMNQKTNRNKTRALVAIAKLSGHYIPLDTGNHFISAGIDLSYVNTTFDLYSQGNVIDLDDLNPATHTGHIHLNNAQYFAGPSASLGLFQQSTFPVRLNVGYEWALISSEWRSNFADVNNTFREDGQGRFYARLVLYI